MKPAQEKEGGVSHHLLSNPHIKDPTAEIIVPPSVDVPTLLAFYSRLQQDKNLEVLRIVGTWSLGTRAQVMQVNGKPVYEALRSCPEVVEVCEGADADGFGAKILRLLTGSRTSNMPLKKFRITLRGQQQQQPKQKRNKKKPRYLR